MNARAPDVLEDPRRQVRDVVSMVAGLADGQVNRRKVVRKVVCLPDEEAKNARIPEPQY